MPDPSAPFRDPTLGRSLVAGLRDRTAHLGRTVRFMEVCGTHTVALFRSGVRSLLPPELEHVSGPGCPVCVTHDREIAALLTLAGRPDVMIASFGDMVRVPGPDGRGLKHARAQGAAVTVVYSPLEALELAAAQPSRLVVFVAVGFETTAPITAGVVLAAQARGLDNFCLFCCHKSVPPALRLLLSDGEHGIDALLLPGHVATVLGLAPFAFIPEIGMPAVVGGFEASDMLAALNVLLDLRLDMARGGKPRLVNAYGRAVAEGGNPKARALMAQVFEPVDALWRGLGLVPSGGLRLRAEYARFDVMTRLGLALPDPDPDAERSTGCQCGEVLRGRIQPPECLLFGTACTPEHPVGPCMVSSEGGCAAWYGHGEGFS